MRVYGIIQPLEWCSPLRRDCLACNRTAVPDGFEGPFVAFVLEESRSWFVSRDVSDLFGRPKPVRSPKDGSMMSVIEVKAAQVTHPWLGWPVSGFGGRLKILQSQSAGVLRQKEARIECGTCSKSGFWRKAMQPIWRVRVELHSLQESQYF